MRSTTIDRGIRTVTGRVNSDGSVSHGTGDFLIRKVGTGDYTVFFLFPIKVVLGATVSPSSGNAAIASALGLTGQSFRVFIINTAGAALDQHFTFSADVQL